MKTLSLLAAPHSGPVCARFPKEPKKPIKIPYLRKNSSLRLLSPSAGNRTQEQTLNYLTTNTIDSGSAHGVNQLTTASKVTTGTTFAGSLSVTGTLTVNGTSTPLSMGTNFNTTIFLPSGTNTVPLIAQDSSGNIRTNKYQVVVPAGSNSSPTYDTDGNELTNGLGQTYTWDAKNELSKITIGSNTYQFGYDALGHRISETDNGTLVKQWVWDGNRMAEERNASNAVTKRFYDLGEQISGSSYYYTFDHLGSVREMMDGSGTIVARYAYDPYGRTTLLSGSNLATLGYAGMQTHQASGLYLTKGQRLYDPATGRWNTPDPSGESGGINLYEYCTNSPIDFADPFGLEKVAFTVISVIRPPDTESGVKTVHTVTVDTDSGKIISGAYFVGDSSLTIPPFAPRYYHGYGHFNQSASGGNGCITVNMTGDAHTALVPIAFLHIQYNFNIDYNSKTGVTKVSGTHTTYPSFEVYKNSTKVFDFQQTNLLGLHPGVPW